MKKVVLILFEQLRISRFFRTVNYANKSQQKKKYQQLQGNEVS